MTVVDEERMRLHSASKRVVEGAASHRSMLATNSATSVAVRPPSLNESYGELVNRSAGMGSPARIARHPRSFCC